MVESKYRHRRISEPSNAPWWAGLVAFVLVSIAAESHALPDHWRHFASVAGVVGVAINAYLIRRP